MRLGDKVREDQTGGTFSNRPHLSGCIYVENHGCASNRFDFEVMIASLIGAGYKISADPKSADMILINTCGVKKPTEDRMRERLRNLSGFKKPQIVAGCLPKINLDVVRKSAPSFSAALDPHSLDKIIDAVRAAENGERNRLFFSQRPKIKLFAPKYGPNNFLEIIQISEGCTGSCSFCCVRFARGVLFSYPKQLVHEKMRKAVREGVREVWITSQDTAAYGMDTGTNLAELLKECCQVEGDFKIRVGMMNPNNVLRIMEDLVSTFEDEKIFKFLHLPVQSGDNEVLERMNRLYSVEDFNRIVAAFRSEIPRLTLSTDVICGFPGESRDAFQRTIELLEETQPDIVNISKFFPRPNTPAANMTPLPADEIKNRSRNLGNIAREISRKRNMAWINWEGRILIDEKGKGDAWIGRNFAYKPIVAYGQGDLLGKFVYVQVTDAFSTYLRARILD